MFSKLYIIYVSKCGLVRLFSVKLFVFITVKHIPSGAGHKCKLTLAGQSVDFRAGLCFGGLFLSGTAPISYSSPLCFFTAKFAYLHALSPQLIFFFLKPTSAPKAPLLYSCRQTALGEFANNLYFAKLMSVLSVHLTRPTDRKAFNTFDHSLLLETQTSLRIQGTYSDGFPVP